MQIRNTAVNKCLYWHRHKLGLRQVHLANCLPCFGSINVIVWIRIQVRVKLHLDPDQIKQEKFLKQSR